MDDKMWYWLTVTRAIKKLDITYHTAQNYIRDATLQICTTTAMFYRNAAMKSSGLQGVNYQTETK